MGTASCKHERTEQTQLHHEYVKWGFWKYQVVTIKCLDCPAEMRVEKCIGRITKQEYSEKPVNKNTCSHEHFDVDIDTKEKKAESTLGGSLLRLFTGPALDGIQYDYYFQALATCLRCGHTFPVRAEFDKVWENQTVVERITGGWKPIKEVKCQN